MGRVISFSEFGRYLEEKRKDVSFVPGTIFDTNILVSLTWEEKGDREELISFIDKWIYGQKVRTFATVTTKSEYLDFFRRLNMTEGLRDAIDSFSKIKIAREPKAKIQTVSGRLSQRVLRGGDPIFNDSDLKEIKKVFSAGKHSGNEGWLYFCEAFLGEKIVLADANLKEMGIEYISQHEESQKNFFHSKIDWPGAIAIAEKTSLGLSDSMILNAFQCSHFSFVVSTDFDLGYAVRCSDYLKDVVMPDDKVKEYRGLHFPEFK